MDFVKPRYIAIQIKAVEVKGAMTIVPTQVLGLTALGTVEEDEEEDEYFGDG